MANNVTNEQIRVSLDVLTPFQSIVDLAVRFPIYVHTVQSDCEQTDTSAGDYIKNKPNLDLKADKVTNATGGNFAGLDANGNLIDSGKKVADFQPAGSYKTTQTAVQTPAASGNAKSFIDTLSQDANGVITATKKTLLNALMGSGNGTCSTAAATTEKEVVLDNYEKELGGLIVVNFDNAVPANATLNINSKGANSIYYTGSPITDNIIKSGDMALFMYTTSTGYTLITTDRIAREAVVGLSISGTTITVTKADGSTSTITTQTNVNADWNQSNSSADNYILNKPAIKAGQGENSIIEGNIDNNVAGGVYSHAEGNNSAATGLVSHAEGSGTTAIGNYSHAEGTSTTASGQQSHAEGRETTASGYCSHAEGRETTASGQNSHTEGTGTIANHKSQHVFGENNIADPSLNSPSSRGNYIEIVGNGATSSAMSNARTLDWQGNEYIQGTEEASLFIGHTPSNENITGNLVWGIADLQRLKIVTLSSATNTITLPNGGTKTFSMQIKVVQDAMGSRGLTFVMDDGNGGTTNIKNTSEVDFSLGSANQSCIATLLYDGNCSWWIEATRYVD